ncbi:hypothetical protein ACUR5C_00275 [Aliikangiella sp. IMCC44653]
MNEILEAIKKSEFPERGEILAGIEDGRYMLFEPGSEPIKARSLLLPIRSKIDVLKNQYQQTEFVKRLIDCSIYLSNELDTDQEMLCRTCILKTDSEFNYMMIVREDYQLCIGAYLQVVKGKENKHIKVVKNV